jgi:hypothetical protein
MGYGVWYLAGRTFANSCEVLSLTIRDLEYKFAEANNFKEIEANLFEEFKTKVQSDCERLRKVREKTNPKKAHLTYPILCNRKM